VAAWKIIKEFPKVRAVIVFIALPLAGCVSSAVQPDSDLDRYKGQDIHVLLNRLGDPQSQEVVSGNAVYRWKASKRADSTPNAPVIVHEGGGAFGVSATPAAVQNLQLSCTLAAETDSSGKILQLRQSGNRDGCADYLTALTQ
jgi:hypothetical protein